MHGPAIYPGTFDPPHKGHMDLIQRGVRLFGSVVVAVADNREKSTFFSPEERVHWLQLCTEAIPSVRVVRFQGLVVDLLGREGSRVLLRGIRTFADFEAEYTMALTNRSISAEIEAETVFVMPSLEYSHYSSRHVKEIASFGGDVCSYLPDQISKEVSSRLEELQGPGTVESGGSQR